ncbi:MAG: hypothetical protein KGL39_06375 [Patescibacteria group bacterium]|nr:hypothetical protein [Patescibacteria group bacterium]
MTSPSIVRQGAPADEPEIWRLFKLHHAENALFPISERKVQFYLDRVLHPERIAEDDSGPRGIVGVIGEPTSLEGAVMLVLGSPWYTDQIGLDDCMSFVDPDHRQSDHSKALLDYAKSVVDRVRAQGHEYFRMTVGIVSTKRTAAKIRLYARRLEPIGAYFMYPPIEGTVGLKNMHRIT